MVQLIRSKTSIVFGTLPTNYYFIGDLDNLRFSSKTAGLDFFLIGKSLTFKNCIFDYNAKFHVNKQKVRPKK